jgi:hypothetical protein
MKNLIKLFFSFLIITVISCDPDSADDILLESTEFEINTFEGKFGAKEFEALEKEALKNRATENNESEKSKNYYKFAYSKEDVINPIIDHKTGKSILIRGKRGIWAKYRSNHLIPGHVYTLWWVIWNNPQNCVIPGECNEPDFPNAAKVGVDILYAGSGHVVGASGKGTFYGRLRAGDDSESMSADFGLPRACGLQKGNTFSAEVHLVLRSHGPKIPGMIRDQSSGYFGGCSTFFDPFTQIPMEKGECGDIEFSIHAPVGR